MIREEWFDIQWWYTGYKKRVIKFLSDPYKVFRDFKKWRKETWCLMWTSHDNLRSVYDNYGFYTHSVCKKCGKIEKW